MGLSDEFMIYVLDQLSGWGKVTARVGKMIGKTVSHYKILERLGSGGMGTVYKARDTKLDRFAALKFLPPHLSRAEEEKNRFIHEAKAASALDHPNICNIYEIDETEDGRLFIAMACDGGESLKDRIGRGPLPVEEALDVAVQIAAGLEKAHAKGIVHRDIKPANILITEDGIAKIVDFGLAKLAGRTMLTREGTTLGTAAYMSPEQTKGTDVDHRADIWALGVMLYEMLCGERPFRGDYEQAVVYSILNEEPEPIRKRNPALPTELEQIVHLALQKDPESRYPSAAKLLKDLEEYRDSLRAAGMGKLSLQTMLRRPHLLIPATDMVLLIALAAVWFFSPVYKGYFERGNDALTSVIETDFGTHQWSEVYTHQIMDLRRSIDYLETRPDIDSRTIAYYSMSFGSMLSPPVLAWLDKYLGPVK